MFPHLFFPSLDTATATLASFGTLAVGYVARPVGGVIFGHFGDRIGRKSMLVMSMVLMGAATVVIGLLPTYQQIGIWAPVLLIMLRLVQGFAVGGEWGGAVLMTLEHARTNRRGLWSSVAQMSFSAESFSAPVVLCPLGRKSGRANPMPVMVIMYMEIASRPGMMPAMNSLPTSCSVIRP